MAEDAAWQHPTGTELCRFCSGVVVRSRTYSGGAVVSLKPPSRTNPAEAGVATVLLVPFAETVLVTLGLHLVRAAFRPVRGLRAPLVRLDFRRGRNCGGEDPRGGRQLCRQRSLLVSSLESRLSDWVCGVVGGVPNTHLLRRGSPGVDDASEAGPVSGGVPNTLSGPDVVPCSLNP